jgi:hypothetical protein
LLPAPVARVSGPAERRSRRRWPRRVMAGTAPHHLLRLGGGPPHGRRPAAAVGLNQRYACQRGADPRTRPGRDAVACVLVPVAVGEVRPSTGQATGPPPGGRSSAGAWRDLCGGARRSETSTSRPRGGRGRGTRAPSCAGWRTHGTRVEPARGGVARATCWRCMGGKVCACRRAEGERGVGTRWLEREARGFPRSSGTSSCRLLQGVVRSARTTRRRRRQPATPPLRRTPPSATRGVRNARASRARRAARLISEAGPPKPGRSCTGSRRP